MLPGAELDPLPVAWQKTSCTCARSAQRRPADRNRPLLLAFDGCARPASDRADLHAILARAFSVAANIARCSIRRFTFSGDPDFLGRIMQMLMPQMKQRVSVPELPQNRRLAAALFGPSTRRYSCLKIASRSMPLSWSDREQLRKVDFDTMTAEEVAAQRRLDRLRVECAARNAPHGAGGARSSARRAEW